MSCAMFSAGDCEGNVRLCELYWWRPEIAVRVPMCKAHGVAFVKGQEPFKGWSFRERLAWAQAKRWPAPVSTMAA